MNAPAMSNEVTALLIDWSNGDKAAYDKLVPLVHDELHRLAHRYMSREGPGHTLQTRLWLTKRICGWSIKKCSGKTAHTFLPSPRR